jgi:hypothetical protein
MRLAVLISVCLSLTMTWLCAKDREVSDSRHLPPLRLAATDLDAILLKTHSLIAAANGPSGEQDSGRENFETWRSEQRDRDTALLACEQRCVPEGSFQIFLYL